MFDIPVDNLYGEKLLLDKMREIQKQRQNECDVVIVSPDAGGAKRAIRISKKLDVSNGEMTISLSLSPSLCECACVR